MSWDVPKKVYCCLHAGKGCPTTPPAPSTMPAPVVPVVPVVTTAMSTTSPCPIDCNAGYNDLDPLQWVRGWSGEKKLYCCRTAHRGCPSELPPPSGLPPSGLPPVADTFQYDCNAGYHPCFECLVRQWSPAKLTYCCKTANKGCPSELPPPSGLPPSNAPPEPDNSVYDCDAGYHHCMHCLELSWSRKKTDYCFKNFHKGCKGEEPE